MTGRKASEETKIKMRKSYKPTTETAWKKISETRLAKMKTFGYLNSPETRKKMSLWRINNPNTCFKDTKIEKKMKELLDALNINYVFQHSVKNIATVDFYIPEKNLIIECDGCYWHGCPIHFPERIRSKDAVRDAKLNLLGYKVIRFWEHEIKTLNTINI